jgi:hypothetical protein
MAYENRRLVCDATDLPTLIENLVTLPQLTHRGPAMRGWYKRLKANVFSVLPAHAQHGRPNLPDPVLVLPINGFEELLLKVT